MFRKCDHVTLKGWAVIISILLLQCPHLSGLKTHEMDPDSRCQESVYYKNRGTLAGDNL